MKKQIAVFLFIAAMLTLAACGSKAATAPSTAETQQETQAPAAQATEAPTEAAAPVNEAVTAGVYRQLWKDEIGGKVTERYSYIVLNEDHTGYWVVQGAASLTWDEKQMKTTVGEICGIAATRENGSVNLLVYQDYNDPKVPSVYEKIAQLPAEIEAIIAEDALSMRGEPDYPGVYCRTWSEEIGGTVATRNSYYVLNEDHTGYVIAQEIGEITWDQNQLTDNLGVTYKIALNWENGTVSLLVYEFQDNATVYGKIEKLPADIENMISMS